MIIAKVPVNGRVRFLKGETLEDIIESLRRLEEEPSASATEEGEG